MTFNKKRTGEVKEEVEFNIPDIDADLSKKPTDDLKLDSPKEKRHDKLNQSEVEEDVRAIM